jgi:hypothetical protein
VFVVWSMLHSLTGDGMMFVVVVLPAPGWVEGVVLVGVVLVGVVLVGVDVDVEGEDDAEELDCGRGLSLWSLNPFASLSFPTICWPSFACWQSSPL